MSYTYLTKEGSDRGYKLWRVSISKNWRNPITLKVENFDSGFKSGEGYDDDNNFCNDSKYDYKSGIYCSKQGYSKYELYVSALTIDISIIPELKEMVISKFHEIIIYNIDQEKKEIERYKANLKNLEDLMNCSVFLNMTRDTKIDQILT